MDPAVESQTPRCRRCGASLKPAAGGLCACCVFNAALTTLDDEQASVEASTLVLDKHQFPGYELLGELARGAMGVVFRARQFRPERLVALKVIAAGELASPKMVERFHTEAETAARLEHPNIVPIFEVGNEGHWHFFSMRLIEGRTLAQALAGGRLRLEETVARMAKIARAVQYAHSRGVLHRDIKPGNILLDAQGEPHLTDFGLAKALEGDSDLTHSEAILGTPAYMAPEQASGRTRDATTAADVYALGAVFYEMLAGRPPFQADNTHALLRKIVEAEAKPPSALAIHDARSAAVAGSVRKSSFVNPADLDAICLKCLEKDPALRYRSAEQLADDLQRALNGEPLLAQPATAMQRFRKWIRRNPAKAGLAVTAVLALALITILSLVFNVRLTRARDAAQANASESRDRLLTQHLRENAHWNAAGNAFLGTWPLIQALGIESNSPRRGKIEERLAATLSLSPRLMHTWSAQDAPVSLKFTADGRKLVAALRSSPARAWDLRTGQALPPSADASRPRRSPAVLSPDGTRVLEFFRTADRYASVWTIETGAAIPLALDSAGGGVGAFAPDGLTVATGGTQARLWNVETGEKLPITITNSLPCTWLMFTPDGSRLLTADGNRRIWLWKLPSGEREAEPIAGDPGLQPRFSPNGSTLLLMATGHIQGVHLETRRIDLSMPHNVTLFELNFHPNGKAFATASFVQQARMLNYPSGEPNQPTITHESGANHAVFSPDGTLVATAGFDYQVRLARYRSHRPAAPVIQRSALIEALVFSPDGRFLALGDASGVIQVWDLDTSPKPLLAEDEGVQAVATTLDASRSFVVRANGEPLLMNPSTGQAETLEHNASVVQATFNRSGSLVAAALGANGAAVWDTTTRQLVVRVGTNEDVRAVAFNGTGDEIATATSTGHLQRWHVRNGPSGTFTNEGGEAISLLRWSEDGRWMAAGGRMALQVFDARDGKRPPLHVPLGPGDELADARFTRDGTRLLHFAKNRGITPTAAKLVEVPSLRVMVSFPHGDGVTCATFSPDEQLIATGGEDNVVRIWRASDGRQVSSELRHQGIVRGVLFRPDGRVLASGSADGTLRLWDVERGELFAPAIQFHRDVQPIAFSAQGTELLVSAVSTLWRIPLTREVPAYIPQFAACLTGSQVDASLRATPLPADELATLVARLRALDPRRFALPTPADMARWHRERAAVAEREGDVLAVRFHLQRLAWLELLSVSEKARLEPAR